MGPKNISESRRATLVEQGFALLEIVKGERWCQLCYNGANDRKIAAAAKQAKEGKASKEPSAMKTPLGKTPTTQKPPSGAHYDPPEVQEQRALPTSSCKCSTGKTVEALQDTKGGT